VIVAIACVQGKHGFATRVLRIIAVGLVIGGVCAPGLAQSPAPIAALKPEAYRTGQAYVRAFEDYLEPGTCAIVLERERCRADFRALQRLAGPRAMDAEVERWLKDGDLDDRIQHWDGMRVPDATWQSDAVFGWSYTAGQLSVAAGLPDDAADRAFLGSIVALLVKHADAPPLEYRDLIGTEASPFQQSRRLREKLDATFPQLPYPSLAADDDAVGYARLGVAVATYQELVDNEVALSRPESRAFAFAILDRIDKIERKWSGSFSTAGLRRTLSGDIPRDRAWIDRELRQAFVPWLTIFKDHPSERGALFAGMFVAQAAYNAAVLKDRQFGGARSAAIFASESQLPKDIVATIAEVDRAPKDSWPRINAAATAAVLAIVGP
jgi:hypothetical protein